MVKTEPTDKNGVQETTSNTPAANCINPWRLTILGDKGKGEIKVASPRIRPVSQMTEPTAFPSAMSGSPATAAVTETAASGNVVPKLTIVAPMNIFGTFHFKES